MSRFHDAYMDERAEQKAQQKANEKAEQKEESPMEWFDWFVTTEEYKELIKEISNEKKLVSETVKPIE